MTEETKGRRWLAIYGAYLALQIRDRLRDGHALPDPQLFKALMEDAATVADIEAEVRVAAHNAGEHLP